MSDLGKSLSGGTAVWKKALDPKRQAKAIEKTVKSPGASGVAATFAGTAGQHTFREGFSEARGEEEAKDLESIEAAEKAKVEEEKAESAKEVLVKKRGLRKRATARKGRRASIVTGPLGAAGEPEIRRATLG